MTMIQWHPKMPLLPVQHNVSTQSLLSVQRTPGLQTLGISRSLLPIGWEPQLHLLSSLQINWVL